MNDKFKKVRYLNNFPKNKTKKNPWRWDPIHQKAFDDVKAAITKEVVLAYPDFSKPFEIYTDASTLQLGAVITPVSYTHLTLPTKA